jgi:hypothetical protein
MQARPQRRYFPGIERSIASIDPALRQSLRRLALGELPWPCFLHGPVGTGKTLAALCLLDHLVEDGLYWTPGGWI